MVLGLTGGIATGKSTVSNILRKKGYIVVDADLIAREVAKSEGVLKGIAQRFGSDMVIKGELNREKLREVVFRDKKKVEELNAIMHPPIIEKIEEELEKNKDEKLVVADIPLLFESKLEYLADKILLVACEKETQVERIIERDKVDRQNALNIIDKQFDLDVKREKSDYVIENNMGIGELEVEVEELLKDLIE